MTQEPVKVPRRKQGNIDYIIREAVDKCLTIRMLEKEGPGDGNGSILKDEGTKKGNETIAATVLPLESTSVDCPACRGRFVVHACGKRARPIDYDAIARAEKEKQEKVEAEKRRLLQERRKLAEKRRKEKKIKKREEERRLQKEMEMEAKNKEDDESLPEASLDLTGTGDERPVASLDLTISENAAAPKYETLDLTRDENAQVEDTDRMSSYRSASSHANTYGDSSQIDRNKYAENSRHHQYDYQETGHHSSYDYSQSSFHHHEGNGIHQATKSRIPDNHKQMDARAANHSSYGSMNYGDSMLSNIPALPSEPSSYYRGGSMNVNLTGQNGDRSGTERN